MRKIILLVIFMVLISFSLCMANEGSLQQAYSYYFQGKMEKAIEIMEEYVKENPDPRVLYFIGYAYYEMKDMKTARRYFDEAYLIDPEFTPIPIKRDDN